MLRFAQALLIIIFQLNIRALFCFCNAKSVYSLVTYKEMHAEFMDRNYFDKQSTVTVYV